MVKWVNSKGCQARVHCASCRGDSVWRQCLLSEKLVDTLDFECPHGITAKNANIVQRDVLVSLAKTIEQLQGISKSERQAKGTCCGQV